MIDDVERYFPQLVEFSGQVGLSTNGASVRMVGIHLNEARGRTLNRDITKIDNSSDSTLYVSYMLPIDYISINTAVGYLIYLVQNYARKDPDTVSLLKYKTIWIVPMLNVDSFEFLLKFYRERSMITFVYKNRKSDKFTNEDKCGRNGLGVNLNKNFPVGFNYDADLNSDEEPCSTNFGGVSPFSELETKAIDEVAKLINPMLIVTLFSANRMITYPNLEMSDTKDPFVEEFKRFLHGFELRNNLKSGIRIFNPLEHQKSRLYSKGGNIDEYFLYKKSRICSV